jgi:hypothetical protein
VHDSAVTQRTGVPDGLRAVVIDTNSTAHGRIDLNALRSLAEVLTRKAPETEIWIPEPVIWEWATHAQEDYDELVATNNAVVRKLNAAGITTSFAKVKDQDRVDVYDAVTQEIEELPHPFRVLRLAEHPHIAIDALRDQITLRPPAKRKSGVKTGASDIASLRLAEKHASTEEAHCAYVIVSDDVDVKAMANWAEVEIRMFPNIHSLRAALLDFQPIEIRRIAEIYRRVVRWLDQVRSGESAMPDLRRGDVDRDLLDLSGKDDYLRLDVELTRIGHVLALHGVDVDADAALGAANVVVRGDLTMTGWQLDEHGEQLVGDSSTATGVLIHLAITFPIENSDANIAVESVSVSDQEWRFDDDDEAFAGALEFLAETPGMESLLDNDGIPVLKLDENEWSGEVNGKVVKICAETPFDPKDDEWNWKIRAELDGASIDVYCYFQDTWMGGSEGDYMEPPYVIGPGHNDLFTMSQFLLAKLYE